MINHQESIVSQFVNVSGILTQEQSLSAPMFPLTDLADGEANIKSLLLQQFCVWRLGPSSLKVESENS